MRTQNDCGRGTRRDRASPVVTVMISVVIAWDAPDVTVPIASSGCGAVVVVDPTWSRPSRTRLSKGALVLVVLGPQPAPVSGRNSGGSPIDDGNAFKGDAPRDRGATFWRTRPGKP